MSHPFDAVLVIAFGGPQGRADIRPFVQNVLRNRRIAPARLEQVVHHYELFEGVSPLTELTMRQAKGLRNRLAAAGVTLPVYVGMRNWHPYLVDTLAKMSDDGARRAIGFIAAAHRSYSGCTQYKENVAAARTEIVRRGHADVEVTYVGDWHTSPGFVAANVKNAVRALESLPEELRSDAALVFTAHSIPESMAERYPYRQQFEETARLVAECVSAEKRPAAAHGYRYATVYQSRSGRPEDPWLGPDICDYLREERARGLKAAVICPVGFICDHIEVLYDLDVEAADVCREIGLTMVRAGAVNDDALFVETMAEAVLQVIRRYERSRPLELLAPV